MDFGEGVKTDAQLTYPAIGNGSFPGILLITGSGAEDMNETAGFIRVDNNTGEKLYPPVPFYQVAGLLDALKIHKVDVLGFFMGSFVAEQLAITHPESQ